MDNVQWEYLVEIKRYNHSCWEHAHSGTFRTAHEAVNSAVGLVTHHTSPAYEVMISKRPHSEWTVIFSAKGEK